MTGMKGLFAVLVLLLPSIGAGAETDSAGQSIPTIIVSGHPAYPPFMWREGDQIVGFGAEIAHAVLTELKIPFENRFAGPWARVQENARKGRVDLIVGLYYNQDRAQYIDYTVPYMEDPVAIFVSKGKAFPYQKWADLIGKKGTAMQGESFGVEFDAFMDKHLSIERGYDPDTNFRRLLAQRVDYFLWGYYPGTVSSKVLGIERRVEVLPWKKPVENMYIGISKRSPLRSHLPQINAIIQRLRESGQIAAWAERYMERYVKTQQSSLDRKVER